MFTPQQIQEQTFSKAVFGGYDMQQVDDFLEPLTEDYIVLYKENSVLKSKMKILVEKLEEYRSQEAQLKQAAAETKAQCDRMIADAKAKCDAISADQARQAQLGALAAGVAEEEERLNCAKQAALNFIDVIEQDIRGHLELLETLKSRDLRVEAKPQQPEQPKPVHEKPYDWQQDTPSAPTASDIASEISENLEKIVGAVPEEEQISAPEAESAPKPVHPESATIKFDDLKFGKNYNPTGV